jgi:putative FmdB family regulatory protein
MPIYEYNCAKCGKTFEIIQKMSDNPLKTHAKCGGKLTKLISRGGFQFKGTGWYVTDYARKGQNPSSDSGSEGSKTSESSTKSATDSKDGGSEKTPAATASATPATSESKDKPSRKSKKTGDS